MQIYWNNRKRLHKKRVQLNSHKIGLEFLNGRCFIVLELQYGGRDVMWKYAID